MATIKTTYVIQSCPVCGTRLLKQTLGSITIGSPLISCTGCGRVYRTDMRAEWEHYPNKLQVFVLPLLLPVLMFVLGAMIENSAAGAFCGILGLLICFFLTLKNVICVIRSKKRMKSPEYVAQLFKYGVITSGELSRFLSKNQ